LTISNNKTILSARYRGEINKDGTVTIKELLSYDFVSNSGFSSATMTNIGDLERKNK